MAASMATTSTVAFLPEIDRSHLFVVHNFLGRALREHCPLHQYSYFFGKAEHDVHVVLMISTAISGLSAATTSRIRWLSEEGTPAAGSSSKSTRGFCASAMAISTRRCRP